MITNKPADLHVDLRRSIMKVKKHKRSARRKGRAFSSLRKAGGHVAFRREHKPAVREITDRFGVRQETLSRMTGFSPRAVAEWARGKEPSAPAKRAFNEMDRLLDALARLMRPKEVGQWLKEPNPAFDGSSPVQVIERGQMDRIWRMLYYAESGEPG
jgi:DNA-binding transcriptional regulator YiaG